MACLSIFYGMAWYFKENICIVYKSNVVVTRSPFEAAKNEVAISEVIKAEIIYNKLDYID